MALLSFLSAPLMNWARSLRFPTLLKITGLLFLLDLLSPDLVPFVDEILLGLGTLLLASWKDRRSGKTDKPRNTAH